MDAGYAIETTLSKKSKKQTTQKLNINMVIIKDIAYIYIEYSSSNPA